MANDDRQLLLASAEGDRSSYALFVRRYTAPLLRFCQMRLGERCAAEDAVQEAMMRLFEQVAREGKIPEEPAGWLFAIARRCCQEQNRQRLRHAAEPLAKAAEPTAPDCTPDNPSVESHLELLHDAEQALLHMKHTRGMRCREIAAETGLPIGTITARLSRIYAKLRVAMSREAAT